MNVKVYNYINLEYMEMMADGDDSMKVVMLEMLIEELPAEISKMQSLQEQSDWNELSSVSHKMKSTLAFVGNNEMTNANKQIETLAKSAQDIQHLNSCVEILVQLVPSTLEELKQELARL